jgi:hypothetical protein
MWQNITSVVASICVSGTLMQPGGANGSLSPDSESAVTAYGLAIGCECGSTDTVYIGGAVGAAAGATAGMLLVR